MADEIRIVRQDTEMSFGDDNRPIERIRVEFRVGTDGPFFERFDKDGFSGTTARQRLETFARELRTMKGQ